MDGLLRICATNFTVSCALMHWFLCALEGGHVRAGIPAVQEPVD